jgi:hypothetical protein
VHIIANVYVFQIFTPRIRCNSATIPGNGTFDAVLKIVHTMKWMTLELSDGKVKVSFQGNAIFHGRNNIVEIETVLTSNKLQQRYRGEV